MYRRAVSLHEKFAVGLLLEAYLHHVDGAFETEHAARECQRRAPLARARFGGEPPGAGSFVVVSLGDRGVGLVTAGGAVALVFVVNVRGRLQRLFETHRAQKRGGAVKRQNVPHFLRNFNRPLRAHLLLDEIFWKNCRQHFRRDGLTRAGVQGRRNWLGEICRQVIPVRRNILNTKRELCLSTHKEICESPIEVLRLPSASLGGRRVVIPDVAEN